MPALFSLAQHEALEAVSTQLGDGESLFAFLDDIYALCKPHRVRAIFDMVKEALDLFAGIQVNLGKTRIWNAPAPGL